MDMLAANSEFGISGKFRTSTFQNFASLYDWANEGFTAFGASSQNVVPISLVKLTEKPELKK